MTTETQQTEVVQSDSATNVERVEGYSFKLGHFNYMCLRHVDKDGDDTWFHETMGTYMPMNFDPPELKQEFARRLEAGLTADTQ